MGLKERQGRKSTSSFMTTCLCDVTLLRDEGQKRDERESTPSIMTTCSSDVTSIGLSPIATGALIGAALLQRIGSPSSTALVPDQHLSSINPGTSWLAIIYISTTIAVFMSTTPPSLFPTSTLPRRGKKMCRYPAPGLAPVMDDFSRRHKNRQHNIQISRKGETYTQPQAMSVKCPKLLFAV